MLGRQDVGHRVVVRRVVGVRDGRTRYSDALGELVAVTDTDLVIDTANGPLRVPLAEIHRAKRVPPPRRPTAAEVVALELAADEAWPAPVRERLGDWLLRAAEGWTGRANSALPVGDPGCPLDGAVDAVQRWYAERDQPAMINVPLPLAAAVGRLLDQRGWRAERPPVLVQTAPLAAVRRAIPARPTRTAELTTAPSAGWLQMAAGRKGGLPDAAGHLLTAVAQVRFAHVYADRATGRPGELLAIARGTVTGRGRWLNLSLVEVRPDARRQGLAQLVIAALADWAAGLGATDAFLQVEQTNHPGLSLYRRLGFRTHHSYQSRVAPGAATAGTC